jgi:hypothetical protein
MSKKVLWHQGQQLTFASHNYVNLPIYVYSQQAWFRVIQSDRWLQPYSKAKDES